MYKFYIFLGFRKNKILEGRIERGRALVEALLGSIMSGIAKLIRWNVLAFLSCPWRKEQGGWRSVVERGGMYSKRVAVIEGNFIILRHYPRYCNAIKLDTLRTPP